MTFLGMGTVEILVILLVAFIFLGPERMVDVARFLGKIVREARRMAADLPELIIEEDESKPQGAPTARRSGVSNPANPGTGNARSRTTPSGASPAQADETSTGGGDRPVAFKPSDVAQPQEDDKSEPGREQR